MMAAETRRTTSAVATKQDSNEFGKLDKMMETFGKSSVALAELILEMRAP